MTTTIPADDICPFPVEVTTERSPNFNYNLIRLTVAPSIKATCNIDSEFIHEREASIEHLRRLLVRKLYANKCSEFFGLMRELESLVYAPPPCFVDCLKVRDVLHKMAELMRYAKPGSEAE